MDRSQSEAFALGRSEVAQTELPGAGRQRQRHAPQSEAELRDLLGVPTDAKRVLILAESSHWDPNWLHTSEEYYDRFVRKILDQALDSLEREARRVYSLESVFFLRMYWDRSPAQRPRIRALMRQRRLRLTSPSVSTADTIIPSTEALLRDFLVGQEWLREHGLEVESRLAYFPDSFGASPALPSLLRAAGFEHTAITRIDGMYFPGFELNVLGRYPRRGSSAELLLQQERTTDFIWRDRSGAQVLAHWNAFSYFQGDLLAHRGFSRSYLFPLAFSDRSERNIARRIRRYVGQLGPLSPTPYLFCPIGVDFIAPIPALVSLLDRYNRHRYPETGVWAVNGGLDDYLNLIEFHREKLPEIELDPNPYWSGFYTARPRLKERCHELLDRIQLAERLSFLPENAGEAESLTEQLRPAQWTSAVANHHDFITGTSPDPTVVNEQIPWLETARELAEGAIYRLDGRYTPEVPEAGNRLPRWEQQGQRLIVETDHYRLELDGALGGAILRAMHPRSGADLLHGPANDLLCYRGSGGLWRMGNEFEGGTWKLHERASEQPIEFEIEERSSGLHLTWESVLGGERLRRSAQFDASSPLIRFKVSGRAPKRRTITASFPAGLDPEQLVMDVPGGVVARPVHKLRVPTYWPLQHFLHLRDGRSGRGLAAFQRRPGAASYGLERGLELIALRNATRERAYRWFPVSGHPAGGYESDRYTFEYALCFTATGDWIENQVPSTAYALQHDGWSTPLQQAVRQRTGRHLSLDRADVWLTANKPASRGAGRILRLYTHTAQGQPVTLRVTPPELLKGAALCDARERDLQSLEARDGSVTLTMPGSIVSIRLIT